MKKDSKNIDRRQFLQIMGAGAVGAALAACGSKTTEGAGPQEPTGDMTMRVNHNTGDTVSILGYGMMRLPMQGEGPDQVIDQEQVNALVDYAMAHGVNYYDTSPVYCQGKSETATGIALSRHPRDKYFIATKLSNFSPDDQTRERSIAMFERSLTELRTDYIDYLLLHAIGDMDGMQKRFIDNGMLDYLIEQKEAGRIRNLGFSFHGQGQFFDEMMAWHDQGRVHWDFVQIQLNYQDWYRPDSYADRGLDAEYLYNELAKRNIPAVIMEPLLGGNLANMPDAFAEKAKSSRPSDSLASWAFRFAGDHPAILTVLSGMTYMEHLQDNVRTYSPLEPMTQDELDLLRQLTLESLKADRVGCTGCAYCMPCPYGVDIPSIFAHYNKCVDEDNAPRSSRDPRYAEARKAFLRGYDNTVPRLRQASMCTGCGECETHCPQELPIRAQLARIDEYVGRLRHGTA